MTERENDGEDKALVRLMRAAGPRERANQDSMERWESAFRAELASVQRRRGRRRRLFAGAMAAAAAVLAVILWPGATAPVPAPVLATLVSYEGRVDLASSRGQKTLAAGRSLDAGSVLETAADGHLVLQLRDHRIRLDASSRISLQSDGLYLHRGRLYASDSGSAARPLIVSTPWGRVSDIGTQFMVEVGEQETLATVRRGAIELRQGKTRQRAAATAGAATLLRINAAAQISEQRVDGSGDRWRWIYRSPVPFELEGSSVRAFLDWVSAETGLRLEFASAEARRLAASTRLHGDLGDWDPEQAIDPVLLSTDLVAQRAGRGRLRVALR